MSQPKGSCPQCGATIQFRFSSAVQTTCEFCHSILVRTDVDLKKVGDVADLPPDVSPIQIGTEGRYQGKAFTVAGRIIYEWEQGGWNEWHIVFQNGESGWLSDAQAEYAVSKLATAAEPLPAVDSVQRGQAFVFDKAPYEVTTLTRARYVGVQGELPFEYWDKTEVLFADLRSVSGSFGTIDYSEDPPLLFLGGAVAFDDLKLTNLREDFDAAAAKSKALECPSCGGSIELRAQGLTQTAVCIQCLSILDAATPTLQIIQQFKAKERVQPLIPLGTSGKWSAGDFQVIGFQCRAITVDDTDYEWREYVLFNRLKGFRYLSEYDGHWNFVTPIQALPAPTVAKGRKAFVWDGKVFAHFQGASAHTTYVMGEFPWRVRVPEEAFCDDYISPPRMLSSETTEQEVTWSVGEYTTGVEVWKAFGLKESAPPAARGIYANQPSPHSGKAKASWVWYVLLFGLMMASAIAIASGMTNATVFRSDYTYVPGSRGEASFVTPVFELKGRPSNVEVTVTTDLDNQWVYLNFALINEETGQGFDWGREVSYYRGRDSDGSWSEGKRHDTSLLGRIPGGRYYLRVEPEYQPDRSSTLSVERPVHYGITLRRDVPQFWPYIVGALMLLIAPIFRTLQTWSFESRRWRESSYADSDSSDDSDAESESDGD